MEVMYISYRDAQILIPFFKHAAERGPYKEAKESAKRILRELDLVRGDISYAPLKGKQIILRVEDDRDFLRDAVEELGEK